MRSPSLAGLRPPRFLVNLFVAGAFLRLAGLGAWSLWLDEGATWSDATKATWGLTVTAEASHPPVWWLVTRAWVRAFGDSESSLRFPAALLSILAIWLVWCVTLRVLDPGRVPARGGFSDAPDGGRGRRVAAWTTGLVAVLGSFIEYGQEARMYPLLLVEALGLALLYLAWLDGGRRRALVGYVALATLALYTHYFAVWILGAHALHALLASRRARRTGSRLDARPFLAAVALSGVLFVPWFVYLLGHFGGIAHLRGEPFSTLVYVAWRIGVGPGIVVADPARAAAGLGALLSETWPFVAFGVVLWLLPVALGVVAVLRRPGLSSFVGATLGVPVGGVLLAYPFFPLVHERYFGFVAPWVVLLAVLGVSSLPRLLSFAGHAGLAVVAAASAVFYVGATAVLVPEGRAGTLDGRPVPARYVADPDAEITAWTDGHPYGREPWRGVHELVRARTRPGDLVALHAWYLDLVWDYYARRDAGPEGPRDVLPLPGDALDAAETLSRFRETLAHRDRVVLVLAHEETHPDPDHWIGTLRSALTRLWFEEGISRFQQIGPIPFPWGIRVVFFVRGSG